MCSTHDKNCNKSQVMLGCLQQSKFFFIQLIPFAVDVYRTTFFWGLCMSHDPVIPTVATSPELPHITVPRGLRYTSSLLIVNGTAPLKLVLGPCSVAVLWSL